jgi:electron transfer flavoprotein alpha subunit
MPSRDGTRRAKPAGFPRDQVMGSLMAQNEIWVMAELRRGVPTRGTFELMTAARGLAGERDLVPVTVLLGGSAADAAILAERCPRVLWAESAQLATHESSRARQAVARLIESRGRPVAILAGASATGLELLPRLSARLGVGYLSHATSLRWEGEALWARRPIYGGRAYEEVTLLQQPAVVTVRAGAFASAEKLPTAGVVERVPVEIPASLGLAIVERRSTLTGGRELTEASRVVAGGRGLGQKENFQQLEELAAVLDGAVGASRAVVDAGWRSPDEQVGKSGKTISPELYIACGISGAIHHVLGMNTAKVVVAINSDPDALIFRAADYGLVADALTIVPALTRALRDASGKG